MEDRERYEISPSIVAQHNDCIYWSYGGIGGYDDSLAQPSSGSHSITFSSGMAYQARSVLCRILFHYWSMTNQVPLSRFF